jgi:hypothetical protein
MNLNAFLDFFNTFFHVSESMQRVGVGRLQYRIFVILKMCFNGSDISDEKKSVPTT